MARMPKYTSSYYRAKKNITGLTEDNWKKSLQIVLNKMYINDNGCWIWTGSTDRKTGYGHIRIGYINYKVHRFMAFCYHKLDIKNLEIQTCHSCDVRRCINPYHLWLGTKSENFLDAVKKNRWHNQYSNKLNIKSETSKGVVAI